MSSSTGKRSTEDDESSLKEPEFPPSKIPRLEYQDPEDEASSSSSSSFSSSSSSSSSSTSSSSSSSSSLESSSSPSFSKGERIKDLDDILGEEKTKADFTPYADPLKNQEESHKPEDQEHDIFDELIDYDLSVSDIISNNHARNNEEVIDQEMYLFTAQEPDKSDREDSAPPPPPPLPPPPPPPPPPPSLKENDETSSENHSKLPEMKACEKVPENEVEDDDDFDEEELDALVNGGVTVCKEEDQEEKAIAHVERIKIVLDDRSKKNFFEVLPDGWIQICHSSGMPIYLHRPTRVISVSKPYFLGKGSVKHHAIPVSSIPCLSYKRGLEEEEEAKKRLENELLDPEKAKNGCPIFPKVKVQSIEEFAINESLTPDKFREFCKGRFIFKELRIKKFNNWTDRRKFQKQIVKKSIKAEIDKTKESIANGSSAKTEEKGKSDGPSKERPTLPEGTKVLSVPMIELEPLDGNSDNPTALHQKVVKKSRKEWIINPVGKSMVCILHEYIQQCLKTQPTYRFEEMESSATPYSATVLINGMEYGRGFGTSKKIAKSEAARITIEILIPEIKSSFPAKPNGEAESGLPDLSFFDDIRIEDPRVNELCNRTSEPSPYIILLNCLQRNYGLGDLNITTELRPLRNKKNEFTMRVDKREVKVVCKNKRDGKQLASQKLLQLLHPHIKSWGSLLSLYGNRAARIQKVKKAKESEVTELQSRSTSDTTPSIAILEKLRKEMLNLKAAKNAMAPIGKFAVPLSSTDTTGSRVERIDL